MLQREQRACLSARKLAWVKLAVGVCVDCMEVFEGGCRFYDDANVGHPHPQCTNSIVV